MHFANAGEAFEDWLAGERLRVTDLVMRALRALVEREERAGNHRSGRVWAHRACDLAPGDESWTRRAMVLLDQANDVGERPSSVRATSSRSPRISTAAPSAETRALAARIRDGSRRRTQRTRSAGDAPAASARADRPAARSQSSQPLQLRRTDRHRSPPRTVSPRRRPRWRPAMIGATLFLGSRPPGCWSARAANEGRAHDRRAKAGARRRIRQSNGRLRAAVARKNDAGLARAGNLAHAISSTSWIPERYSCRVARPQVPQSTRSRSRIAPGPHWWFREATIALAIRSSFRPA